MLLFLLGWLLVVLGFVVEIIVFIHFLYLGRELDRVNASDFKTRLLDSCCGCGDGET